jgi:hypothetical protein
MAKVNYAFEKRQKELAKKKKREEKMARKAEAKAAAEKEAGGTPAGTDEQKSEGEAGEEGQA